MVALLRHLFGVPHTVFAQSLTLTCLRSSAELFDIFSQLTRVRLLLELTWLFARATAIRLELLLDHLDDLIHVFRCRCHLLPLATVGRFTRLLVAFVTHLIVLVATFP